MKKKSLEYLGCTPNQQKVLDYLIKNKNKKLTPRTIAKDLGFKESAPISGTLKKFEKIGYIVKEGKGKNVTYENIND